MVVREPFADMESSEDFLSRVTRGIPANLGQIATDSGTVLMPDILNEPSRKRKRASDSGNCNTTGDVGS